MTRSTTASASPLDPIERLKTLSKTSAHLYSKSDIVRIVEVARKYSNLDGPLNSAPHHTHVGGPNGYKLDENEWAWTQGFFPTSLWLLVERNRLLPGTLEAAGYTEDEVISLARLWGTSYEDMVRPAQNHDQGFRFQMPYGRDLALTGNKKAIPILIEAAESLVDRYDPDVGCIRSWNAMRKLDLPDKYRQDNQDEHFLVIIDNMMNLDLMFQATDLTGDKKYADIAIRQAERMQSHHIRPDYTTFHVADYGPGDEIRFQGTCQDDSCWSRGQAWAMYGFAQVAQRTRRSDFLLTSRRLTDKFLSLLPESGVPPWDFHAPQAPQPAPYDTSAGCIAARAMQMLYGLLVKSDRQAAEHYLAASFRLLDDITRVSASPAAKVDKDGKVDWGEGGWETILQHSTVMNNPDAGWSVADVGLVYADTYFLEAGNEALKLAAASEVAQK